MSAVLNQIRRIQMSASGAGECDAQFALKKRCELGLARLWKPDPNVFSTEGRVAMLPSSTLFASG